jgi:hypothetical protein
MSYVIAAPEMMAAAATDLAGIGREDRATARKSSSRGVVGYSKPRRSAAT